MLRFKQGILQIQVQVGEIGGSVSVGLEGANIPAETLEISAYGGAVFNINLKDKELSSQPVLTISGTVPYKAEQLLLQAAELSALRFTLAESRSVPLPIRDQQASLDLDFFQREQIIDYISVKNPDLRYELLNRGLQAPVLLNITEAKAFTKQSELPLDLQQSQLLVPAVAEGSSDSVQTYVQSGLREIIERNHGTIPS